MTSEEQKVVYERIFSELHELRQKKGHDYAASGDVLSNFKLTAKLSGDTDYGSILRFMNTKIVRLNNLATKTEVKNEPVEDSLMDLINYGILAICMREEEKNKSEMNDSLLCIDTGRTNGFSMTDGTTALNTTPIDNHTAILSED